MRVRRRIGMQSVDHKEAMRLTWKSRHIPMGTILLVFSVFVGVLSAILTILAESPSNPIP
jgi:hypothetical protein